MLTTSTTAPALLVLAAGLGSRYGGLKQTDPVGPSGETLLDYAVFDALRAGFRRVTFLIRPDFADAFRRQIAAKYAGQVAVDYAFQTPDNLPPPFAAPASRQNPWGTGHALWCARENLADAPFAVIGADDFFGRDAFVRLAAFLDNPPPPAANAPARYAMVGYKLANTLSENGAVSRGVCAATPDGALSSVTEHTGILRSDIGAKFTGDETVSMNCWAFTPEIFAPLGRQLAAFLARAIADPRAEFYLPEAVSAQIAAGQAAVRVLPTTASWFGVTHREDKPRAQAALARLVASGEYPARLF
jgi:NDP-sugar pyrophosphorylase family protein